MVKDLEQNHRFLRLAVGPGQVWGSWEASPGSEEGS